MNKKVNVVLVSIFLLAGFVLSTDAQTRQRRNRTKPSPQTLPAEQTLPSFAIKTLSGLTYLKTKAGAGHRPKIGDTVVVHYTGTLTNGVKFDSSRDRGEPFSFPLGQGRVIKGWDEGIARMSVGDQAILVIPPSIGYGSRGAGAVIPPDATLIFIVELVDIKSP